MFGPMRKLVLPVLAAAAALWAAPALAGPYDKVFFVKRGGTATQMYEDREACGKVADTIGEGRGGEAYGDPEYGMISAMGAALEADSMQNVGKAVRRAALEKCMEKRGWSQLDPADSDEKAVRRASRKEPQALDAWLKANEPAPVQTAAAPPAPAAPAPAAAVAAPVAQPAPAPAPLVATPAAQPAPAVATAPPPAPTPPAAAEAAPAPAPVAASEAAKPPQP